MECLPMVEGAGNKTESQTMFDSLVKDTPDDPALLLAQVYLLRDDRLWDELKNKTLEWYRKHPENSRTLSVIAGNLASLDSDESKKTAEEIPFPDFLRRVFCDEGQEYSLMFGIDRSAHTKLLYWFLPAAVSFPPCRHPR